MFVDGFRITDVISVYIETDFDLLQCLLHIEIPRFSLQYPLFAWTETLEINNIIHR